VALERSKEAYLREQIMVMPLEINNELSWIDYAGYTVAHSQKPTTWPELPSLFEFKLKVSSSEIACEAYRQYA
jgi:hypothetical protein